MPYIDTGEGDLMRNMMMLMQILNQVGARKTGQAQNLYERSKPGQTVEQAGLDPKQFKRLFGRTPGTGEVLKPHTAETRMSDLTLDFIDKAPPNVLSVLAASSASRGVGVPQITTAEGITSQAAQAEETAKGGVVKARTARRIAEGTEEPTVQAETTRAVTIAAAVDKGAAAFKRAPQKTQEAMGQLGIFGKTAEEVEVSQLEVGVKAELYREAMKARVDPKHPLRALFKKELGVDLDAAIGAAGLGMLSLVETAAQLRASLRINRAEVETAIQKEMAATAGKLSVATGMKFSPRAFIAEWDARELHGKTNGGELGELFDWVTTLEARASIADAVKRGDPNVATVTEILSVMRNTTDKKVIEAASTLLRQPVGVIKTTQLLGPRPQQPGMEQTNWDVQAQRMGNRYGLGIERTGWFGMKVTGTGVDKLQVGGQQQDPNPLHPGSTQSGQPQAPSMVNLPPDLSAEEIKAIQELFGAFYTGGTNAPKP